MISEDEGKYMDLALDLALKGWGQTNPNPLVGAVLVKDGKIAGRGYHERFGGPHAEVMAIEDAGEESKGSTMYVTLEPCSHHGKTPPCVDKIIDAGVKKVVIPWQDPNSEVSGRGVKKLREAGIEVEVGLKKEKAARQNEIFEKYITRGIPFVISKWAMSLDGKIATYKGDSKWITSDYARQDVHFWRARAACILVGINTVIKDDPVLTCRHPDYTSHHPTRVILDSKLKIPLDSRIVKSAGEVPTIIATGKDAPEERIKALSKKEVTTITCSKLNYSKKEEENKNDIDLKVLLNKLGERGYDSIFVEGGSEVHGKFLELSLTDKLMCYVGNKVIGGVSALSPVGGKGAARVNDALDIGKMNVEFMGENIKVTGYPE